MLILVILAAASALLLFWLLMLMTVSRNDWISAAQSKRTDDVMKIAELLRKDAAKAEKLKQYSGISAWVMGLFLGRTSKKKIAKLKKEIEALDKGKLNGINLFDMPGYTLQRVFPFIREGALQKDISTKCLELYGKKFSRDKAQQIMAQLSSYPFPGVALSLLAGAYLMAQGETSQGLGIMVIGAAVVGVLVYAIYNDVDSKLRQRRQSISRQFPNVVSKLALLCTSGMNMAQAWRQTAESKEQELYQEMRITAGEMSRTNMSLAEAYENFIDRCNTKETTRLASAVLQSEQKGNQEIGALLQNMAHEAWQERQHNARRDAEASNSKLIIPTLLLFGVILAMIMIPVVMRFGEF